MELSFKIKEIPATGAPLRLQRPVPAALLLDVLAGTEGDAGRSHAQVDLELFRDHDEVVGRGRVRGALGLPCSRCLEPAKVPVDTRVDFLFRREGVEPEEKEVDGEVDEPDTFTHDGMTLSLVEPLRELLIAELPISVLCKDDCRGLCATCGANQNTPEGRACGHAAQAGDTDAPRKPLAGLSEIKLPS